MAYIINLYILNFVSLLVITHGKIIRPPVDEEVVVSGTVTLFCQSDAVATFPIEWNHRPVGTITYPELVYEEGKFFTGYKERSRITGNSSSGEFNLEITKAVLSDAGKYICKETKTESKSIAELIVLDSYPNNRDCSVDPASESAVAFSFNGQVPDTIRLSCNLSYQGNLEAVLEWKYGTGSPIASTTKVIGNISVFSVELKADELASNDIVCRIKYVNSTLESNFNWSTSVAVLRNETKTYNIGCMDESDRLIDCSLSTSHQCTYRWIKLHSVESQSGPVIHVTNLNKTSAYYTCKAYCIVHGQNCSLTPAVLNYTCPIEDNEFNKIGLGITITIVLVLTSVIVAIIIFLYLRHRK